jgi:hypothetical protein
MRATGAKSRENRSSVDPVLVGDDVAVGGDPERREDLVAQVPEAREAAPVSRHGSGADHWAVTDESCFWGMHDSRVVIGFVAAGLPPHAR